MLRAIGLKKRRLVSLLLKKNLPSLLRTIVRQNVSRNESLEGIYQEGHIDYNKLRHHQIFEFTLYKNPQSSLSPSRNPTHRSNFLFKRGYYAV